MKNLHDILKPEGYKKIKFKIIKTQHLVIQIKINGVKGKFILDTGASNSCVGFESVELFMLNAKASKTLAAGAGATGMQTKVAKNNLLQIGYWKDPELELVIFNLTHVNEALLQHNASPVHGIIGADVLTKGQAIIDYYNHYLYLK